MNDRYSPTEADLAALADGSIAPRRREPLLTRVRQSPELSEELARQQRAVEMMRAIDVKAPAELHRRITALGTSVPPQRARKPRLLAGGGLLCALGAVLAVLLIALGGGTHSSPSLAQITALTLAPATTGAPAESTANGAQLAVSVRRVPFPYWGERFGWRTTGARVDHIAHHTVTMVFYESPSHQRIGYAILDGAGENPRGGKVIARGGVWFTLLHSKGVSTVTWRRSGDQCVISGQHVSDATLLKLASWNDRQAT
jgi:anti-sigma factor RsiW